MILWIPFLSVALVLLSLLLHYACNLALSVRLRLRLRERIDAVREVLES